MSSPAFTDRSGSTLATPRSGKRSRIRGLFQPLEPILADPSEEIPKQNAFNKLMGAAKGAAISLAKSPMKIANAISKNRKDGSSAAIGLEDLCGISVDELQLILRIATDKKRK